MCKHQSTCFYSWHFKLILLVKWLLLFSSFFSFMAHNYFVVTVINIPFVLLITTFTYEGWRYKSRAFESEVSDFLLSARRLLKWDQCSGCMTTQTPSLLTVPFCYDCFHRCGLVHVWLQSVHGERTAHCPVCMFFRDVVNYVSDSFFPSNIHFWD